MTAARIAPYLTFAAAGALSACVAYPVGPLPQPLAAVPGGNKTPTQFAQDDAACRASADRVPGTAATNQGTAQQNPSGTPESVYFSCMQSKGNSVGTSTTYAQGAAVYPYEVTAPYYAAVSPFLYGGFGYPFYGYGGYYPGVFADGLFLDRALGFGYGGFYGGYGFGRFGYGYGGYRGGYGGFRGGYGGGYRGYAGGGFGHGGGFHR